MVGVLGSKGYTRVVDLSGEEARGRYFEGTGVLVLDRINGVAYVSLSERADKVRMRRPLPPRPPILHHTRTPWMPRTWAERRTHLHMCALPKQSGQLVSAFCHLPL